MSSWIVSLFRPLKISRQKWRFFLLIPLHNPFPQIDVIFSCNFHPFILCWNKSKSYRNHFMKNFLFVFFSLLFPFSVHAQSVSVIPHLSSIALNKDETVTVTPYHYGMACGGKNCGNKIVFSENIIWDFSEIFNLAVINGYKDYSIFCQQIPCHL